MPNCSVIGCKSGHGNDNYQTFVFPKSEELKSLWIEQLNREDFVLSTNSRICEKHFAAECFIEDYDPSKGMDYFITFLAASHRPRQL